jgi:hypothetical protein
MPEIGWYGDWGMAASAADSDYVHVLIGYLRETIGYEPDVRIASIVPFEQDFAQFQNLPGSEFSDLTAFKPDLVILRIGDNVETATAVKQDFLSSFAALISFLSRSDSAVVVATSSWFPKATVDACMRIACEQEDTWFVDISDLYADRRNLASSERSYSDPGVAIHPGDAGMRAIANRLWEVIGPML